MEMQNKAMARAGDRLSDLPDSVLLHILSMLLKGKQVVRTSVLSTRWRFLWMSVPVSIEFEFGCWSRGSERDILDLMTSVHRELYYWRSCQKIRNFSVFRLRYEERYVKDVDLWVHFATKDANVQDFTLYLLSSNGQRYEFPQFAYNNTSLRRLVLSNCQLNPSGSISWSKLVSLYFSHMKLTEGVMEKVLSGCPNLERLELDSVSGIHRLEITSVKLRELVIESHENENRALWLDILAPNIQTLQLLGYCDAIRIQQRNVASLVAAQLHFDFAFDDEEGNLEKECRYWKELLQGVAHVKNLSLGHGGIECLSILELRGWRSPPSSRKFLELQGALVQLDLPGICSFLQSSLDLETLVIDWYMLEPREMLSKCTNEDEQSRRFETHNFNCSLLHLKNIKIINFRPVNENKFVLRLVKYLLKNATVLEKFVIATRFEESDESWDYVTESDESWDYVTMSQELLSFPRSSPHASVVFS